MCLTLVHKGLRRHNKVWLFIASETANWSEKQTTELAGSHKYGVHNEWTEMHWQKNTCITWNVRAVSVVRRRSASLVLQMRTRSSVLFYSWEHVNASHGLRLMWSFTTPPRHQRPSGVMQVCCRSPTSLPVNALSLRSDFGIAGNEVISLVKINLFA